jgi:hypothetical protein
MKHFSRRSRDLALLALVGLAVAACGGDPAITPPPQENPETMYWQLTLNVRAATMSTVAPYDTLQLVATPRTVHGTPIADLARPTYTSLDLDHVQVDSNGLVHVVRSGDQVFVVASLEDHNVLHADTVVLNITDESSPPTMATFTIHPAAGDSAKTGSTSNATVTPRAFTADGTPILDISTYFSVSDITTATINRSTGYLSPIHAGHLDVYAATTTFGVTKVDTLPYTIGYPTLILINISQQMQPNGQSIPVFIPDSVVLGPGAGVVFINQFGPATDVTFDDPTNIAQDVLFCLFGPITCGTGNIAPWTFDPNDLSGLSSWRVRDFPVPGTYNFHSALFGTTGIIVIADESTH